MPLNSTSAVILGLLHDGPATGGEIVASASRRLAAQGGVTRSQVYRELPALADAGFIRAGAGSSPAQAYAITAHGRAEFNRWVTSASGADSVRSNALLRLGFGAYLTTEQRRAVVEAARAEHLAALSAHRHGAAELQRAGDAYAAATAQFAVAYERAFLKWLESVPIG